jgi:hypothetical protein
MIEQYNDVLNNLRDYILDENNMQKSLKMKIFSSKNYDCKKTVIKDNNFKKEAIFIPREKDTLFWCYFIIMNGDIKYESLYNKNDLVSKQMKIDLVDLIRKNKDIIKINKFDTISNLESNLANDHLLNSKSFLTLCAINNINVIFISKKTYYELITNDTNLIYIVYDIQCQNNYYKKYGFQIGNNEIIDNIKSTLYKVDKIDKPIRTFSYYKVEDLINICDKLAIEKIDKITGKNKSKKDLYELIIQYF